MPGARWKQRRRVLRAGGPAALKRWHDSVLPPIRTTVTDAMRSWWDESLYSTSQGYADPLNAHILYGLPTLRQPGPALRGITVY